MAAEAAMALQASLPPSLQGGGHLRLGRQQTARSVLTGNSFSTTVGRPEGSRQPLALNTEFASDVGRKKFGFGHEELDDATAYYEGQFKLHMRWGDGTLHSPETGAKYVGQFRNDKFHGEGDQVWSDGSKYAGQWQDGQKHGRGDYSSAEQLKYAGQWERGRRHGQGAQEYANGDRYEGWWFRGMCSGLGTYFFADGSQYQGAWANGRYEGAGILSGSDGLRERRCYSNGMLVKLEVLPAAGPPPKNGILGSRKNLLRGSALYEQTREEMQKPTIFSRAATSNFLIRRETDGADLSARPLKPLRPLADVKPQGVACLRDCPDTSGAAPRLLLTAR